MKKFTRFDTFIQKMQDRYRLVVLDENTLEDVWYTVLSRMNILAWIGLIGLVLVTLGIVLVSFTPLREYIPGYPDGNIRWQYMKNTLMVDSLEHQIQMRDKYIANIQNILKGEETLPHYKTSDSTSALTTINKKPQTFDSVLENQLVEEERYNVNATSTPIESRIEINKLHFYCPLKGAITNEFSSIGNHYGIDIVSNLNEPVLSILEGTVVFTGWTLDAGNVIVVQHHNDLLSVYKHNSQLLKEIGNLVKAGEAIAIVGNTGELTTGPHLHFELWHSGKPLNPSDYIVF
jgi:ABC-type multidrug transport system fused ATPase/permease subunit